MPGATAFFVTGCVGDLNTGHSAAASLSLAPMPARTFAEAARIGERVAAAALAAPLTPLASAVSARAAEVALPFARREDDLSALARRWEAEAREADPVRRVLLDCWVRWAAGAALRPLAPLAARVSLLDWGGLRLIGMPGEIFAATALGIRGRCDGPLMLAGFCEDNPGYVPPREEYAHGGYEVEEAHRFYGMPATFAPGAAETLADAAVSLAAAQPH
jgi:neutral ceramidase